MSKDDGTYVLKLKGECVGDEYRVAVAHAILNVFKRYSVLASLFRNSPKFTELEEAWKSADEQEKLNRTEHGIELISHFSEQSWPDIEALALGEPPYV